MNLDEPFDLLGRLKSAAKRGRKGTNNNSQKPSVDITTNTNNQMNLNSEHSETVFGIGKHRKSGWGIEQESTTTSSSNSHSRMKQLTKRDQVQSGSNNDDDYIPEIPEIDNDTILNLDNLRTPNNALVEESTYQALDKRLQLGAKSNLASLDGIDISVLSCALCPESVFLQQQKMAPAVWTMDTLFNDISNCTTAT